MKNIFTSIILIVTFNLVGISNAKAQFVTIPDANFATWLNTYYPSCMNGNQMDTTCSGIVNEDTVIVYNLNIQDLSGIQWFDNLKLLWCMNNQLTNLSALPASLIRLECQNNQLSFLPTLPNTLKYLECGANQLIGLPNLPNSLQTILCYDNQLTSLPTLPNNLLSINFSNNQITVLPTLPNTISGLNCRGNLLTTLPQLPNSLWNFICSGNQLDSLPQLPSSLQYLSCISCSLNSLPALPLALVSLECSGNLLTTLPSLPNNLTQLNCQNNFLTNLPQLPNLLTHLICDNNGLTALPQLSGSLFFLQCFNNQLTSLPQFPSTLTSINCYSNQLTNLPALPNSLLHLTCDSNQLTTLPLLPNSIRYLKCNNNQISYLPTLPGIMDGLFIQNNNISCVTNLPQISPDWGGFTGNFNISNNPLSCVPNQTTYSLGLPFCVNNDLINNPYGCAGAEGIVGIIFNDNNNNCQLNSTDITPTNILIKFFNPITNQFGSTYSGINGVYDYPTGASTNFVLVDTLNKPYKANCPHPGIDSTVVTTTANPLAQNVNFDIACKNGLDLGVQSITHNGLVFPGQPHTLQVITGDASQWYGLNCSAGASGQISITINGPVTYTGVPIGAMAPSISGNVYTYSIADFGAVNSQTAFKLLFTTNTNAQSGDNVCVNVNISTTSVDNDTTNNNSYLCYQVVNSYDPNYKEVSPINVEPDFNDWLTYTIHFQNLGTAPAFNIRILDTLDQNLNLNTFEVIGYSHANNTILNNNVLTVRFPNIMLPDSASNPSGSQGYIQYRIKPLQNLPVGTQIENTAHIYFDFNPAIVTNTTVNEYVTTVTASAKNIENELRISPNPSNGVFYVGSNTKVKSLEVFDCVGNTIMQKSNVNNFDLSDFSNGIYFVRVNGNQYSKVIKN